jgi:chorismate-pyruvate lyase
MSGDDLNLENEINLDVLVSLFYSNASMIGEFHQVPAGDLSSVYEGLLNHESHMTVTVERYHGCPVDVQVLEARHNGNFYSRKILLNRQSDNGVVQFGIVSIDTRVLAPDVFAEIAEQKTPLGRILINHNVLRDVHLNHLYKIAAGPELASCFQVPVGHWVAGRTAIIDCDGKPAIGLLEIVI